MKMKKLNLLQPFHLVTLSPWPLIMSFSILNFMVSLVNWFNKFSFFPVLVFLFLSILVLYQWWRDVVRESFMQGFHTSKVVDGLKMGMILFIISEIFFFISIFWSYFHMFLSPSIEIGGVFWPPKNIIAFNPYEIPFLNTLILLSSGVLITWCHYSILQSDYLFSVYSLFFTIILGLIFSFFQYIEYKNASFTFSDSVYGSSFFMATGFHGFHVLVGAYFLMMNLIRLVYLNFSSFHHVGFEMAAWYWHFVDVVWLFLYLVIYFWSY